MATARPRASQPAQHANVPVRASHKAAFSPAVKIAFVVIGTAGLAALAIAIFGPERFQRQILKPVKSAVGDQAGQLWSDSRPLREQIGKLFARAGSEAGRDRLVRNFQSWIGHFRAS